ncbi:uncharacterized protein LOC128964741 [Oppia nitens]|uniref:uncharacterized protein LOC128964741 n=1 Tax=Oppia nitens TaxID=1686743 RepID=UPI0023DA1485|nr:uncharacterized protein LOC128964741 [Oppia nitens]
MDLIFILFLICYQITLSLLYSNQNNISSQLMYSIGDSKMDNIYVHLDNQTIEMIGHKDLYNCFNKAKNMVSQCTSIVAIQWNINDLRYDVTDDDRSGDQNGDQITSSSSSVDLFAFNFTHINNSLIKEVKLLNDMSYGESVCCVLNELIDCIDYNLVKQCKGHAVNQIKQINQLIISENSYNCSHTLTAKCMTILKLIKAPKYIVNESQVITDSGHNILLYLNLKS